MRFRFPRGLRRFSPGLALTLAISGGAAWALWPADPDLPRVAESIASGEPLRIVAFGSSSTEGVGASSPGASYPARLQDALRKVLNRHGAEVIVLNRGIGGEGVDEMMRRFDRDVLAARPQLVIWQTGSNDPMRGVTIDHFRTSTVAALHRLREAGIDVILMEPQWCPKLEAIPRAAAFRDAVREIGEAEDVPVIRRSDLMREWVAERRVTQGEMIAPDGLHMRDAGYRLLADAAVQEILRGANP